MHFFSGKHVRGMECLRGDDCFDIGSLTPVDLANLDLPGGMCFARSPKESGQKRTATGTARTIGLVKEGADVVKKFPKTSVTITGINSNSAAKKAARVARKKGVQAVIEEEKGSNSFRIVMSAIVIALALMAYNCNGNNNENQSTADAASVTYKKK